MQLKCNMGKIDKAVRLVIGCVLIYLGFIDRTIIPDSMIAIIVGIIGVINIVVASVGVCPAYSMANISTAPKDS